MDMLEDRERELEVFTCMNPDFGWPDDDCWHEGHRKELQERRDPSV